MSLLATEVQAAASARKAYLAAQMASVRFIATNLQGTAGGIAETSDGDTFAVISADSSEAVLYRNDAGSPVALGFALPGEQAFEDRKSEVEALVEQAQDAVASASQLFDTLQQKRTGILRGGFFMGRSIRASTDIDTFYVEICGEGDDGSFDITLLDDDFPISGPITVSTAGGPETSNPGVTVAAGSNVSCWVDNITGTVTAFYAKAEGRPAS